MELVPQFNETAEHRTENGVNDYRDDAPQYGTDDVVTESMFRHPSAVSLVEKIDYLYDVAQKVEAIVSQISPAQIQQVNSMVNGPLGPLFAKLFTR